jgi:hypothetical protein
MKATKSGKIKIQADTEVPELAHSEEEYKFFLKNVELYALGVDSIEAKLERAAYAQAHSEQVSKIEKKIENTFALSELTKDHFDIAATFVFTMQLEGETPFLRIAVKYGAHFHWKNKRPKKDHIERFAEGEARLIFWPYFRQAIADLTSRMYIRPVTIPLTLSL